MNNFVAEFIGSFILMLAIMSVSNPLYISTAFLASITIFGPVSGAHLNPAVSIAKVFDGGLAMSQLPVYCSAQVLGAVSAVIMYNKFLS